MSRRRRPRSLCTTGGRRVPVRPKRLYDDEAAAVEEARRLAVTNGYPYDVYRCEVEGGWHVGRARVRQPRREPDVRALPDELGLRAFSHLMQGDERRVLKRRWRAVYKKVLSVR